MFVNITCKYVWHKLWNTLQQVSISLSTYARIHILFFNDF